MRALTVAVVLGACALIPGATLALTASSSSPHPRDAVGRGQFGYTVALSGTGTTAIVGADTDDHHRGAAYVFVRSGRHWRQQGPKLTLSDKGAVGEPLMGQSVSISADGNTALVGGYVPDPGDASNDSGILGALIFTRDHGAWTLEATLTDDRENDDIDNGAMALSADGSSAIIGDDEGGSDGEGAAFVFTRHHGDWSTHAHELLPFHGTSEFEDFGQAVALSANGDTAVVGGKGDGFEQGAVWVYHRHNDIWTRGHKIVPRSSSTGSFAGSAVAVSGDGDTVLIGGYFDRDLFGSAWVYTRRPNGAWVQLGHKLHPAGNKREAAFGEAVALSRDGRTAVIGGPYDDINRGAVWLFARHPGGFRAQGQPRRIAGHGFLRFGRSVALSGDGRVAMAGSPNWHHRTGTVAVLQP